MQHATCKGGVRAGEFLRTVLLALTVVVIGIVPGCGPKVEPNTKVDIMGGTDDAERQKIKGYLDAAGIKGEIVSVTDMGNEWGVGVGAPPPKPGERPSAVMPSDYRIDKATGKVQGAGMPGAQ